MLVIPTAYEIMDEWREALIARVKRTVGTDHRRHASQPDASSAD